MARYIDADKIDFRLPYFTDENGDALVSLKTVKRCIAMTPTEDVAPKSEVAKAIISEIADCCRIEDSTNVDFVIGYTTAANKVLSKLFELKKKYTEGCGDEE